MALTEIILAIANVIFIIIAVFLFVRLRKIGKKGEPEKQQQTEPPHTTNFAPAETAPKEKKESILDLGSIMKTTPAETRLERFEMKEQDITPPEKPMAITPDIAAAGKAELRLEDELPEVKEKPAKKESKKKKAAKKVLEKVIEQAIKKETGAPSEEISVPETKEENPARKESKKKKPAKKEPEKAVEIKEETAEPPEKIPIPETKEEPEKKESKKKKPAKKEPEKVVEIKEEPKAIPGKKPTQKEKALPQEEKAAKAGKKLSKKKTGKR